MPDTRDVAQRYIDQGWSVVPIVRGEKRAATNWSKKTYAADDFKPDDNIAGKCGEPSGWRVDIDLDASEAVQVAKLLLPITGLIHGRPGKSDSHYWFICDGAKTAQFTDVKDTLGKTGMLVEVRSSGGYTLLPPSIHPGGDLLAWSVERDPLVITPDDMYQAVQGVAIGTLLARHWPGPGLRHAAVGHLAGFLARAGAVHIQQVISAAAHVAKDPDVRDRESFVRDTLAKYKAGEVVSGGRKLAEALGEDVVAKLRSWLGLADDDAIEEMNARHFVVRLGKDEVIGTEEHDDTVFQYRRALELRYANRRIVAGKNKKGEDQVKPLFQAWLEHHSRRDFRQVVFAPPPTPCDPRDYNLWKGFAIAPADGVYPLFAAHMRDIICAGDDAHFAYLLKLLAYMVQRPGSPGEVAVVLKGGAGAGKGIFVRALSTLFGRHAVHLDKVSQFVGHFNAHLSAKVLVFADEAFWAGDKREAGALKRLITEPTQTIERKGLDSVQERNCVHLFMATNENWAVPAMLKERRFFALRVSDTRQGDFSYFTALQKEIDSGGLAALLKDLLAMPVTLEDVRNVPKTKELRVQQERSLTKELEFWQTSLYDGVLLGDDWPQWVSCKRLYDTYFEWCRARNMRALNNVAFGMEITRFVSSSSTRAHRFSGKVERSLEVRPLVDARKFFDSELGTTTEWPVTPSGGYAPNLPI